MPPRKSGRPCKYGYEQIEVGCALKLSFDDSSLLERARRSSLSYARRSGRRFITTSLVFCNENTLTISRIE